MVKNLLSILSLRQSTIISGAAILMLTVAAAKILGLIRDRLLAHTFSPEQIATFLAAFRIPDLIFQLFIFGAVSVAFIPIFTEYLNKKGEEDAFKFASDILNIVLLAFVAVSIVVFIFAFPLTQLVVPGFTLEQQQVTASLTRIILFGQVLLAIGSFFAGILQSFQRFIVPSMAAVFYNIGIIFGIYYLSPQIGLYGPAAGVIIGAAMHAIIQIPLVSALGYHHRISLVLMAEGIRETIALMGVRTIGVAVEQINETVGIILASLVSTASVTYLTFAQHLYTVPVGLFGATLAQAALPILSRERSRGEDGLFKSTLLTTFHQILFLTLPAAAILIVLRIPAVRLVFGASQFDWDATVLTGKTVALLAIGLAAQSVVLLLMRGFYAFKDTRTPVIISVSTVTLNIILSVVFVRVLELEVWSLGLSYAIATNLSVILLIKALEKKIGKFSQEELVIPALKMIIAAMVAAIALYIPVKALDQLVFDTTRTINLLILTGIASVFGLSVYVLIIWLLRVKELDSFTRFLKRLYDMQFKVKSQEMVKETGTP